MTSSGTLAVDWGTTNRRIFVLDARGKVVDRVADGLGVTSVAAGGFPAEIAALNARFGTMPKVLAGMIGSNRGWVEAPYLDCPADIDALAAALIAVEGSDARIVPGLCDRREGNADVMRGEEVQLLGAVAEGLIAPDAAVCHPGTHAKWARIANGAMANFRSIMTGEMFALLRKHSLLAASLSGPADTGSAFQAGVARALERRELLADLFGVRARILLGKLAEADAASFASGLLIGSDIAIGVDVVGEGEIALIGDPALTALYATALTQAGRANRQIDGETAFVAGIKAIAARA